MKSHGVGIELVALPKKMGGGGTLKLCTIRRLVANRCRLEERVSFSFSDFNRNICTYQTGNFAPLHCNFFLLHDNFVLLHGNFSLLHRVFFFLYSNFFHQHCGHVTKTRARLFFPQRMAMVEAFKGRVCTCGLKGARRVFSVCKTWIKFSFTNSHHGRQ